MRNIEACRTEVLGGHLDTCAHCGHGTPSYNSCSDRHCPKCQSLSQAKWIAARKERILPTGYFHVVFTLPAELRSVAKCNQQLVYDMLFATASETLLELGRDEEHLGGLLGITVVLHTWTRKLEFHPHVHCIVTGGGLDVAGNQWRAANPKCLFPVKVMSKLFRGKFLDALNRAHQGNKLVFAGGCAKLESPRNFADLKDELYGKEWVVYSKRPFGGPQNVFDYLGRYTHRVAISNQRLISMNDQGVTFFTKNNKTATLPPEEFIRRFLQHVLPKGFTKIRHFGLLAAGNVNSKLVQAHSILAGQNPKCAAALVKSRELADEQVEKIRAQYRTPLKCPRCHGDKMVRSALPNRPHGYYPPTKRDTS